MKTRFSKASMVALGLFVVLPVRAQEPPVLRLTRDLRIDAAEHDLTPITPPGGMTVGPDGTIAFSQNQDGTKVVR